MKPSGITRLAILLLTVAAISIGCGGGNDSGTEDGSEAGTKWLVGYSQCNRNEPWREQMDKDIVAHAAKHPEIELKTKDAQNEVYLQIQHIREFISQDADAIIVSPKDTSLSEVIGEAFDAGIPVIVLDRAVDGDRFTCFIGSDNRKIGAAVGEWVVEQLNGQGSVVELQGLASSVPASHRSDPFRAALEGTDIEIVYSADMEWLGDKAREKMLAALTRNPEPNSIQLVYGANDPAAIQAWYAAKDKGREGEMIFVGVDALPHEGMKAVENGILDATFLYPNGTDVAIETVLSILAGEEVEKQITLGTRLFTPENLAEGGLAVE